MDEPQRRPAFTGLVVHRDPSVGYSLLLPDGWQRADLPDDGGTLYRPDPADPTTGLEIGGSDLGTEVSSRDLPAIRRGFLAGLRQLPRCQIEQQEDTAIGDLLTLEARLTYCQDEATRKRWVRLLYQGSVQVRLVAEGLATTLPNRNTIVSAIDYANLPHYLDALMLMHRVTARLAAERRQPHHIDVLRGHQRDFAAAVADADAIAMIAANREFHVAIAVAGGNSYYIDLFARLLDEGMRLLRLYYRTYEDHLPQEFVDEHEAPEVQLAPQPVWATRHDAAIIETGDERDRVFGAAHQAAPDLAARERIEQRHQRIVDLDQVLEFHRVSAAGSEPILPEHGGGRRARMEW